ncbi:MAG: type II toxin-antitoxin system RelE family toxin [Pseudomonadota bacterium]
MYALDFRRSAARRLGRLAKRHREVYDRIWRGLENIASNPYARNTNVRPLAGIDKGYRLRIGDWRVCYVVDDRRRTVDVFEIELRGSAYRWA